MKPLVNLYKLGRLPYVKALNVQQVLFDKLKNNVTSMGARSEVDDLKLGADCNGDSKEDYTSFQPNAARNSLILVEHEPVYTIGIRSKEYNDDYVSKLKNELNKHKLEVDFVKTNRGGLITFHGPGQLVAYPIIYLGDFNKTIKNRSVKFYVNALESTIIDALSMIGLQGAHTVREHPGVWMDCGQRKIAFIGIACKRFVTMHGISINCDCDLSWFDFIESCGIVDRSMTSVRQELLLFSQTQDSSEQHFGTPTNCFTEKGVNVPENGISSIDDETKVCTSQPQQQIKKLCNEGIIRTRSNVEHISEAFCSSFSQHFDCRLIETDGEINNCNDSTLNP